MKNQRYGMLFNTVNENYYYYDTGTGKVAGCSLDEARLIHKILQNKVSLENACNEDKCFASFIQ